MGIEKEAREEVINSSIPIQGAASWAEAIPITSKNLSSQAQNVSVARLD
jgi:hypothetical protein